VEFVKSFRFERLGVFAYSEEDGTPAATMDEQVPLEVREARRDEIMSLQQDIAEVRVARRAHTQLAQLSAHSARVKLSVVRIPALSSVRRHSRRAGWARRWRWW
jgi:tRNA A37 methylthiotransferase MiaB